MMGVVPFQNHNSSLKYQDMIKTMTIYYEQATQERKYTKFHRKWLFDYFPCYTIHFKKLCVDYIILKTSLQELFLINEF